MSSRSRVPRPAARRLSLYLRELKLRARDGSATISSRQLGEALGLTDAQVRKDLAHFGHFGQPGVGYRCIDLLERLRWEGRSILISTHRLHEIERRCDRFLISHAGRIVAAGTREEMIAAPGGLEGAFFAAVEPGAHP